MSWEDGMNQGSPHASVRVALQHTEEESEIPHNSPYSFSHGATPTSPQQLTQQWQVLGHRGQSL